MTVNTVATRNNDDSKMRIEILVSNFKFRIPRASQLPLGELIEFRDIFGVSKQQSPLDTADH